MYGCNVYIYMYVMYVILYYVCVLYIYNYIKNIVHIYMYIYITYIHILLVRIYNFHKTLANRHVVFIKNIL